MNNETRWGTYKTNAAAKDWVGREAMHNIDDRPEPLEQFGVALPESVKLPCLFLRYIKDRTGVVIAIDPFSGSVVAEIFPNLLGVLRQSSTEKRLKVGGQGGDGKARTWNKSGRFERKGEEGELTEVKPFTQPVLMMNVEPIT